MTLRPATVDDIETLFDIRCSVTENHQSREELAALGITVESVSAMVASGDFVTTIAEIDGQPAGFSMAQISEGYVFACFVRAECHGLGVGGALMAAAEEGLHRAGVKEAWLSTGEVERFRAPGFYRHLGWVDSGHLEDGQIRFTKVLS
ncbi:GNAT family N-acetyltransferase [Halomonas sp. ML-15]|uniref:GNAT family N-acetyltransferase n=1 Tax=Halomonas sp. ML-15 TaxID=2773305 RepID=UPI00174724F9|nr:GNAT family N-acetyltransferase [Halomonas sp. ML-15]MBD3897205.1 GNAT family N-acetyltransferase [Halomonas sp. ML-15]